jgi:flagellar hook-length control protein FliK
VDAAAATANTRVSNESPRWNADTTAGAGSGAGAQPNLPVHVADGNVTVVNALRTTDRSGQTEIRVEMQMESLGNLELRAHVLGNQIGATIAVEHHDAQAMLATSLPALHSALIEKNIHVNTVIVSQGSQTSMNGGHGGEAGHKTFSASQAKLFHAGFADAASMFSEIPLEWAGAGDASARLSVRA